MLVLVCSFTKNVCKLIGNPFDVFSTNCPARFFIHHFERQTPLSVVELTGDCPNSRCREVFNGLRRLQRSHFRKTIAKLDKTELAHPCADDCKCARPLDVNDDLQFMCTKKCIPCHRCGSSMKFFMRRVKYLNTVKEYPAYRCMKKKCQTFRSPRTLARECNMLLRQRQTGGDSKVISMGPTTNATRQLKEAFPDHFGPSGPDEGTANDFKPEDFDSPAERCRSPVLLVNREKEAWFAMNCAKNSLTTLLYNGSSLSQRLKTIVNEIHAIASHFTLSNPLPTSNVNLMIHFFDFPLLQH